MQELITTIESLLGPHVEWKQVLLVGMTPIFLLAFAIEVQLLRRKGQRPVVVWRDVFTNFSLGGGYQLFELLVHTLFVGAAVLWFWQHRLFTLPINGWTLPLLFVVQEFCYYWFHRASHRVRWFWTAHVVHHTGLTMNMSTAMRQSLLYPLTGWWLFFMPMVLLGVHPTVVFLLYACNLSYQFFIHTEIVGKLHPVLEYLFDTPSNHRVHHGRNPRYIDKNYGGVLIVFDRWFGTYQEELEAVDYGIAQRQPQGSNPLWLNLHEMRDLLRDALKPGPLWLRLKHFWQAPEWQRPEPDLSAQAQKR